MKISIIVNLLLTVVLSVVYLRAKKQQSRIENVSPIDQIIQKEGVVMIFEVRGFHITVPHMTIEHLHQYLKPYFQIIRE